MDHTRYDRLKAIAVWTVIVEGMLLIVLMGVDIFVTYDSMQETLTNREVLCIGRYLEGLEYAPACESIITQYEENRN